MKTSGNTIFITGGTSGIGRGIAEAFHRQGNQVIISGRRKGLLDEVTRANPGMHGVELDIQDPQQIKAAAAQLVRDFPDLNVLFNNAGIMPFDDAAGTIDDETAVATVATNLLGPVRMTSALLPHLKTRDDAAVIHNSSVLAFVPLASTAVYSATKAAMHSYALSQRFMLAGSGVRVIEISPPWVDTDLVYKSGDARAMPLPDFVAATMAGLADGRDEVYVDGIQALRDNPGSGEHAFVNAFNQSLKDNPIPVGH
ncbi:SDR family oxidoreductase [Pseudoduganella umbonata]|uniref:Putative oxidoreductase n=1 Tax=Pseudoduganella umbonata TaxID=864828 RepID=A0A4P8HN52_9BURK|nr:SDR family NAD(P)-dependent oxidoreductase [Pseudoduganella umbonata]MBB3221292.1 putative oxidoreductase [Pseudoduganella umbonata]QCP10466.1 SDR family NAD(P)-dependent oxidoreductase [Pseudoduganella umbonata]